MIINKKDYLQAVSSLENGNVVIVPTETVMGIMSVYDSEKGYKRLIELKNRPQNKNFPFAFSSLTMIEKYCYVNEKERKIIKSFLPGPLTIILRKKDVISNNLTNNLATLAIRIPKEKVLIDIIRKLNKPILLTSANKSGEKETYSSKEAYEVFKEEALIIKGKSKISKASTIVKIENDEVVIIRQGLITKEEILEKLKGE